MVAARLPLLRGRISTVDNFVAPRGGGGSDVDLPIRDPAMHKGRLVQQLDAIARQVETRIATGRDELATREIVAETGTVLLDVASAKLEYLRDKLDAFADDTRTNLKTAKDGTKTVHRDKERAIAPIETIGLAALNDIRGPQLRAETLFADRAYWFEVACRGGYCRPRSEMETSRSQIARPLHRVGAAQKVCQLVAKAVNGRL